MARIDDEAALPALPEAPGERRPMLVARGPEPVRGTWGAPRPVEPLTPRVHLLVLAAFVLLTVAFLFPIVANLTTQVPGGGDAWQHIWNLWWVKRALLEGPTNPYYTNLLFYPDGTNLYFHTLVLTAGLTGIPLQLAGLNLITTYNLILLSTFVLAGYGTFLLCHYLTGRRWAAFVGGIVFAFAPYHAARLFGHMNLVSLQWIPFFVLLLLRAIDAPGSRPAGETRAGRTSASRNGHLASALAGAGKRGMLLSMAAGLLLAVNAYTDWTYAVFMALLTVLVLAWKLLVPSERAAFSAAGLGWAEGLARIAAGGAVFLALVAPVLLPTLSEAQKGYAQQPPRETLVYSSDLVSSFVPSELHPLWGTSIRDWANTVQPYMPIKNPSERVVFLGYTVLLSALATVILLRRRRQVLFWGLTAVLTWLLSLGPLLQMAGRTTFTVFGVTIPLPYLVIYRLPLFSIMRTPSRFVVVTMLCLAILVAFGLAALSGARARRGVARAASDSRAWGSTLLQIALPVLAIFEFLPKIDMVPPGWNVPIYAQIAREPGSFAILELPLRPFSDYMAYQTIHGKPIIGGYISRQPPYPTQETNPTLKYLSDTTDPADPLATDISNGKGLQQLHNLNVHYLIVHWWAFTADQRKTMETKLATLLARPPDVTYPSEQVDVWKIP